MKVAYYLQRGRWDGFLAKGTHTRTFQFSAARISYASVRFCQHSSAPTRFSCILNFHVLKKNWIIFGNVHHLKVFDGKIASKIYEYKQTNHNKKSWKYYKKYAEVWSQIAFPKKFHTHAHYKHFCNSLTQFLYTFQVFSSLHCKDWTRFHLGPDDLLHYIHFFSNKVMDVDEVDHLDLVQSLPCKLENTWKVHSHYKHFCNSHSQFLCTFQVFSSLH